MGLRKQHWGLRNFSKTCLPAKGSLRWCTVFRQRRVVPLKCTTLPVRTHLAWPVHRCSGGFDAAGKRRSPTRLQRHYERPEAAPEPRRLLHLRLPNPRMLLLWKILCFAAECNAAAAEDEGSTNLFQQPRGLINIRRTERRTASCLPEISPCLCMFGSGVR